MTKLIENFPVRINNARLLRRIRSSRKKNPRWVQDIVNECLGNIAPVPAAVYDFFDARIDKKKRIILLGDVEFHSGFMVDRFSFAKELGLIIVTIGPGVEELARKEFSGGDMLRGVIYDAIGSEYVESAADAAEEIIEKEKGCCMSRYSPGYNDWDIREQSKLFSLLDGARIGVSLNKSSLMNPEKSISAMLGFSDRELKRCKDCSQQGCDYRGLMNG